MIYTYIFVKRAISRKRKEKIFDRILFLIAIVRVVITYACVRYTCITKLKITWKEIHSRRYYFQLVINYSRVSLALSSLLRNARFGTPIAVVIIRVSRKALPFIHALRNEKHFTF